MKTKIIYINLVFVLFSLLIGCNKKTLPFENNKQFSNDTIIGNIIKGKWSLQPNRKEINLYFVGKIINQTSDTLYLSYKDSFSYKYGYALDPSYFYILVNKDTIQFQQLTTMRRISPYDSIPINLLQILPYDKYPWAKDYFSVLDTCTLQYSYPYDEEGKIKELTFSRTKNFRIDPLPDNTFYETAFFIEEWLE